MASSNGLANHVARAAAILTTGEVAGTIFDLTNALEQDVTVQIAFTQGSLTNGIFRFYVSMDNSTFVPLYGPSAAALTQTYTADTTSVIPIKANGWRYLRVSVQGTGTVTSSSATVTIRYLKRFWR
jgi:hypothetical protein